MLTQQRLKELLRYNLSTGEFVWIEEVSKCTRLTTKAKAGCITRRGYTRIIVDGKSYQAHRLVWLYNFGSFPSGQIDHINGVKNDNRLSNLRECSQAENMRNTKMKSNNTSGITGVGYTEVNQRCGSTDTYWSARWTDINGKHRSKHFAVSKHGYDQAKVLAVACRNERMLELKSLGVGYTERHGI